MTKQLEIAVQRPNWLSTLCEALDTPVSLKLAILWRYGEWDQIASFSIDPHQYDDSPWGAERFARDLQAQDILRKFREMPTSYNRDEECEKSFVKAEQICAQTNRRLKLLRNDMYENFPETLTNMRIFAFVDECRRRVRAILGPLPHKLEEPRFGPGATFESRSFSARDVTLGDKITEPIAATHEAISVFRHTVEDTALDRHANMVARLYSVRGNRFTTVPKNAKTSRGICVEPGANVYCQLSVGRYIRDRLLRAGIDLRHNQHLHARLAHEGSLSGAWCTIDLESASDTVAYQLVKLMLPENWFQLLSSLRSPRTLFKGSWHYLEKFSSMGNGFTFELESLLFAVISQVSCNGILGVDVFVYGDDIIVPNASYRDVVAALRYFGFTPNTKKSYSTSPFRESCGGQFFAGRPIRTVKLEETPNSPPEWFSFHNGLCRYDYVLTKRTRLRLLDNLPSHVKSLRGPSVLGDQVLWEEDRSRWIRKKHEDWDMYLVRGIMIQVEKVELAHFPPGTLFSLALYGLPNAPLPTRRISGFKVVWRVPYGITQT